MGTPYCLVTNGYLKKADCKKREVQKAPDITSKKSGVRVSRPPPHYSTISAAAGGILSLTGKIGPTNKAGEISLIYRSDVAICGYRYRAVEVRRELAVRPSQIDGPASHTSGRTCLFSFCLRLILRITVRAAPSAARSIAK